MIQHHEEPPQFHLQVQYSPKLNKQSSIIRQSIILLYRTFKITPFRVRLLRGLRAVWLFGDGDGLEASDLGKLGECNVAGECPVGLVGVPSGEPSSSTDTVPCAVFCASFL